MNFVMRTMDKKLLVVHSLNMIRINIDPSTVSFCVSICIDCQHVTCGYSRTPNSHLRISRRRLFFLSPIHPAPPISHLHPLRPTTLSVFPPINRDNTTSLQTPLNRASQRFCSPTSPLARSR